MNSAGQSAGFVAGARHALAGIKLIRQPGIRAFVVIPLAINIVLFALAIYGVSYFLDSAIETYLGSWPEWIQTVIWWLFAILSAVTVFFTFTLIANVVASPFNGLLSEAVERHLRGDLEQVPWSLGRILGDLRRTIVAELRKLFYILVRALPLFLLSLIPIVNAAAPVLWLLFGAWMLCLEYLDCPLGNHSAFFPRVVDEMRARRRLALGFGGVMTLITMIPILNFVAMPVGVAGATSLYCQRIDANA